MRRITFSLFLSLLFLSLFAENGPEQVNLEYKHHNSNHVGLPYVPADQPDVYYDSVNQTVIIDGGGEVSYYDVEIASTSNWTVYVSTQVLGTYDTIDVSSLPQGEYCITIYSP